MFIVFIIIFLSCIALRVVSWLSPLSMISTIVNLYGRGWCPNYSDKTLNEKGSMLLPLLMQADMATVLNSNWLIQKAAYDALR